MGFVTKIDVLKLPLRDKFVPTDAVDRERFAMMPIAVWL